MNRRIPTPSEVRQAASQVVPAHAAIRYEAVRQHVQRTLRTTRQRSDAWLTQALLDPTSDLALICTSDVGTVRRCENDGQGEVDLKPVGTASWRVVLTQHGNHYGFVNDLSGHAYMDDWVISVATLNQFANQARTAYETRVRAESDYNGRAIEILHENYGDALGILRGLLAQAGALRNTVDPEHGDVDQTFTARVRAARDGTLHGEVVITLRGNDIAAVAAQLRAFGVQAADQPVRTNS